MTESAQQPEVSKEVSQSARPEQVREFDAKLLQMLPELTKEQMQHLIENPEEMRARLRSYGFGNFEYAVPSTFSSCYQPSRQVDPWKEFYADEFQVDPDFSRVRLPNSRVMTYVTPIRVAPQLRIEAILDVIQKHGVEVERTNSCGEEKSLNLEEIRDIGRPQENYIVAFSTKILENLPSTIREEGRYRGSCMTFREHLLWIAYCLYRRDIAATGTDKLRAANDFATCLGSFNLCASISDGQTPLLGFWDNGDGKLRLRIWPSSFEQMSKSPLWTFDFFVRRTKLYVSLPQI